MKIGTNAAVKKNVGRCKDCPMVSLTDFSTHASMIGGDSFELDWTFQSDIDRSKKYRDRVPQHKPDALLKGLPTVSARDLRSSDDVKIPAQNMNLKQMIPNAPKTKSADPVRPGQSKPPPAPVPAAKPQAAKKSSDSKPVQLRRIVPSKAVIRR
jgi:hypothetical protein